MAHDIDSNNYRRARDLVMKHGWNTTCFQIVNPGIEYWFGYVLVLVVLLVRPQGLFGEKIIDRV